LLTSTGQKSDVNNHSSADAWTRTHPARLCIECGTVVQDITPDGTPCHWGCWAIRQRREAAS
jgi:hypothetical protein